MERVDCVDPDINGDNFTASSSRTAGRRTLPLRRPSAGLDWFVTKVQ